MKTERTMTILLPVNSVGHGKTLRDALELATGIKSVLHISTARQESVNTRQVSGADIQPSHYFLRIEVPVLLGANKLIGMTAGSHV